MDETRPLVISHIIAAALGAAWLVLVYTLPPAPPGIALLRPEEAAAVEVQFEEEPPPAPPVAPSEPAPAPESKEPSAAEKEKARREEAVMADAFGGGSSALVGDVTNALRGVNVTKGTGGVGGVGAGGAAGGGGAGGGKAVIAYGSGGAAVRTPGRGLDPSVTAAGAGIGRVNAAGSVTRATIAVAAPTIARGGEGGASGRDMAKLGTFVRARQAQLQYCYLDVGLAANAALAGSVNVMVTLDAAGAVRDVRVTGRTWSGAGSAETEQCITARVRTWSFPGSAKGGEESYSF